MVGKRMKVGPRVNVVMVAMGVPRSGVNSILHHLAVRKRHDSPILSLQDAGDDKTCSGAWTYQGSSIREYGGTTMSKAGDAVFAVDFSSNDPWGICGAFGNPPLVGVLRDPWNMMASFSRTYPGAAYPYREWLAMWKMKKSGDARFWKWVDYNDWLKHEWPALHPGGSAFDGGKFSDNAQCMGHNERWSCKQFLQDLRIVPVLQDRSFVRAALEEYPALSEIVLKEMAYDFSDI